MERTADNLAARILVIDDEREMCITIKELLESEGYTVTTAQSGVEGLQQLRQNRFDLVLCDIFMPDLGGFSLLSKIHFEIPVVMMTAYASVETTRKAFKMGVRDYLVKPFKTSELLLIIKQSIAEQNCEKSGKRKKSIHFLTNNPAMMNILRNIARFAKTDVPILIEGESGVGKELLANYIQAESDRYDKPYVRMNCAAIPESLLESELFGYEKGAFTGAFESKSGTFETAHDGTILLDEIGDMPLALQAKILRILQEFRFSRIGSRKEITSNVRIIASTNRNLKTLMQRGEFREDLFHRINGVRFHIPPLRDRLEDILLLIDYFGKEFSAKYSLSYRGFSPQAVNLLQAYRWPGNIRELKHVIERSVILSEGAVIEPDQLPDSIVKYKDADDASESSAENKIENIEIDNKTEYSQNDGSQKLKLHNSESLFSFMDELKEEHLRDLVIETLRSVNGNKKEAAIRLRISRKTLYNWMKRLQIKSEFN